jgi:glycerophosphoryl diester phosphodiesterase
MNWPLYFHAALIAGGLCAASLSNAFDLQGHRGARGLLPENTLAGFDRALDLGVTTLELDTGLSKDRVVVIHHDETLNANLTRDASGAWIDAPTPRLRDLSLRELKRYDVGRIRPGTAYAETFATQQSIDGSRIPTLLELFSHVKRRGANQVRFNIEAKTNPLHPDRTIGPKPLIEGILRAVARHNMEARVSIQSFDWRALAHAKALNPRIPTVCLTAQRPTFLTVSPAWNAGLELNDFAHLPAMVRAAGCDTWSPHHQDLNAPMLKQAQALGLKVIPWTVNEESRMKELIEMGVDGLITDRPDIGMTQVRR